VSAARPRLVPVLLLKHGLLVRSQWFRIHQVIGNPVATAERYSHWNVDELVLLDISDHDHHDLRRDDLELRMAGTTALDVLRAVAPACAMPLTFGGRIRTLEDMRLRLEAGADKCVITTGAIDDPDLIGAAATRFGSQFVVVGIDAARAADGALEVFADGGGRPTGLHPAEWAAEAERRGAGEILLQSIDRDGTGSGYDLDLVRAVSEAVTIPVVACGGVGRYEHLAPAIAAGASAAAAANLFHFFELSYPNAKREMIAAGVPVRPVSLGSRFFPRERTIDTAERDRRLAYRAAAAGAALPRDTPRPPEPMRWCTRCVYPVISAVPLELDEHGVCSGCRVHDARMEIPAAEWARRRELLVELLERARSRDGGRHDCVIPVSGGKDSWFQAHTIVELGFNPLLVTYNGNNWTPAGWRNVHRMKEVFGLDHVMISPSVRTLTALNRLGMSVMGDMNWHAHVGITTAPVQEAVRRGIPLVIWGEHGYLDLGGQFSFDDFPEMSYRDRYEHFARGYEWNYFVGLEGLRAGDMTTYRYPSDAAMHAIDLRGIYLGNFVPWDANEHVHEMIDRYGFEVSDEPFDRTYRRFSNLDDMHENGVHDYLKFIKFGYGRATDHACKDIRAGAISRDEGIALVRKHDHVKPRDLARWLAYTGTTEEWFDRVADTFRDPRVWRREAGAWVRDEIGAAVVAA
jgi:imidazoleglycerol phosphate synthase cyclase subunit